MYLFFNWFRFELVFKNKEQEKNEMIMSKANYYKFERTMDGKSSSIPTCLISSTIVSDAEKIFLMNLMKYRTELNYKEISAKFGIGQSTVKRYIMSLKKKNVITVSDTGAITLSNEN